MAKSFQHGTANRHYNRLDGTLFQVVAETDASDRKHYAALMVELRRLTSWTEASQLVMSLETEYRRTNRANPPYSWLIEQVGNLIDGLRCEYLTVDGMVTTSPAGLDEIPY